MTIYLGIDPSYSATGWVFLSVSNGKYRIIDAGTIKKTEKKADKDKSAGEKYSAYMDAIKQQLCVHNLFSYCHSIAVEVNFKTIFSRGFAPSYFIACGIVAAVLHSTAPKKVFEYSPNQTRRAVTGSGTAKKDQVMEAVTNLLGEEVNKLDEHQIDAIATIFCHLKTLNK